MLLKYFNFGALVRLRTKYASMFFHALFCRSTGALFEKNNKKRKMVFPNKANLKNNVFVFVSRTNMLNSCITVGSNNLKTECL